MAVDVVGISVRAEEDSAARNYRRGGGMKRIAISLMLLLLYNLLLADYRLVIGPILAFISRL